MNKLVSILKSAKKPLIPFLAGGVLAASSFLMSGCDEPAPPVPAPPPSTGPVINIDTIVTQQQGGAFGLNAEYPDSVYCDDAAGIPDLGTVGFFGHEGFTFFLKYGYGYLHDIANITCEITNTTSLESAVLGIGDYEPDYYWSPENCANANIYYGNNEIAGSGLSRLFWMTGYCKKWPITGMFVTKDESSEIGIRWEEIGDFPWFGEVPEYFNVNGLFSITCLSASKKIIASAPYTLMRNSEYWFANGGMNDWGDLCEQQTPEVTIPAMAMGEPEIIYKEASPDLEALNKSRSNDARMGISSHVPAWQSKNTQSFAYLSRDNILRVSGAGGRVNFENFKTSQVYEGSIVDTYDAQSMNGQATHNLEHITSNSAAGIIEPNSPIAAFTIETPEDLWNVSALYWVHSFYKPSELADVNFLEPRYSNGSTFMFHTTDNNGVMDYYEIKVFPRWQGEDATGPYVGGWCNGIVPTYTAGSEGFYEHPDANLPPDWNRTAVLVREGDTISAPYPIPENAPFTARGLERFCNNYLKEDTYDMACDVYPTTGLDLWVDLRDYAVKANNWGKTD